MRRDDAGDGEEVHRQRGVGLPLLRPVFHDARGGAVGDPHAIAEQDDDVFSPAAELGQGDDFEVAVT